jgi:DNA-binding transcriptional ArsR family regulator
LVFQFLQLFPAPFDWGVENGLPERQGFLPYLQTMNQDARDIVALDKVIHEPARLAIMAVLYASDAADFLFLLNCTGLSKGNLSTHIAKLEEAGYVEVTKSFKGKIPNTAYALTRQGRTAFTRYHKGLREITKRVGKAMQ